VTWNHVTTNHAWYWFRALDHALANATAPARQSTGRRPEAAWGHSGTWAQAVEGWAQTGRLSEETRRGLGDWLERHPEIERCFRSVLASSDNRVPAPVESTLLDRVWLLSHYPLVAAASSESEGRWTDAFHALTDGWRFQARLTPPEEFAALFDERGADQLNALIARPWRRLALTGPSLPEPAVRRLLEDLAGVTNTLGSLEASYLRRVALDATAGAAECQPNWARVRTAFRVAGLRLRQEFGSLTAGLLERLLGGRRPAPLKAEGIRHLGRPLSEWLVAVQRTVARPEDFECVREARLSHALAELRPTQAAFVAWPRHDHWSSWRRALDRPAVWNSVRSLPEPAALRESRAHWLVLLESCRLTLALRAYHDQHGRWPVDWNDLVPAILPAVPLDPFSGEPFGYEQTGDSWIFWSVGPSGRRPTLEEAQFPPQRLFSSSEPTRP
jgi:hypothetical protein